LGNERKRVFLDSCILIAATHSPGGGSALVTEICQGNAYKAAVSVQVLLEARMNIAEKFGYAELIKYYHLLARLDPEMIPVPAKKTLDKYISLVADKDIHVLATALEGCADYLVTLDKRHLLNPVILAAELKIKIMTPGDFLKAVINIG
jgi:predicted nucleic acid-binding protein